MAGTDTFVQFSFLYKFMPINFYSASLHNYKVVTRTYNESIVTLNRHEFCTGMFTIEFKKCLVLRLHLCDYFVNKVVEMLISMHIAVFEAVRCLANSDSNIAKLLHFVPQLNFHLLHLIKIF